MSGYGTIDDTDRQRLGIDHPLNKGFDWRHYEKAVHFTFKLMISQPSIQLQKWAEDHLQPGEYMLEWRRDDERYVIQRGDQHWWWPDPPPRLQGLRIDGEDVTLYATPGAPHTVEVTLPPLPLTEAVELALVPDDPVTARLDSDFLDIFGGPRC